MPEQQQHAAPDTFDHDLDDQRGEGGAAVATRTRAKHTPVSHMPQWKVLLHNDDVNETGYVIETILELTPLTPQTALVRMLEAHETGVALLLSTHREYAELLAEQFVSKRLQVTIEPDR